MASEPTTTSLDPMVEIGTANLRRLEALERKAERRVYGGSLYKFQQAIWPVIEPGREFMPNYHIGALCEHLEAVTKGEILRLVVNVPPGTGKSVCVAISWPCWAWTHDPCSRWLFSSYASALAIRDSRKRREVFKSAFFRQHWPELRLKADQDTAHRFENSQQGFMLATSTGAGSTGEHANTLVYDDPHDRMDRFSKVKREEAVNWFRTVFTSLNLGPLTRYVIVAQRITEDDMTGYVLANELGYEHLCIPLLWDSRHPYATKPTKIGWLDPRKIDGDPMWPAMFPPAALMQLKREKGSYDLGAQYQQNPAHDEGSMFPRSSYCYFRSEEVNGDEVLVLTQRDGTERRVLAAQCQWFQCADTALETGDDSAWTVNGTFAITPQPAALLIYDMARERIPVPRQYGWLMQQRQKFPRVLAQYVEKKASGHGILQEAAMRGTAFGVLKPGDHSKEQRLVPASIQYENGVVYHRAQAPWLADFENEIVALPDSQWKDQGDVLAYAGMIFQRTWLEGAYASQPIAYLPDTPEERLEREQAAKDPVTDRMRQPSLAELLTGRRVDEMRPEREEWWDN